MKGVAEIVLFSALIRCQSFFLSPFRTTPRFSTRQHNFFKKLLEESFANDGQLSRDKSQGQLDLPEDEARETGTRTPLTATQEKWRDLNSNIAKVKGETFCMDFYLSGVPNRDPSNDLYGSKVNISSRDRQVGLALPEQPTVSDVAIAFLPSGKCECLSATPFTEKGEGDWILSEDGKQIRFRIQVTGYSRTVETKGTIQSVAWSDQSDQELRSSTVYKVPEGWLYGEAVVSRNAKGEAKWEECVLKIEQTAGLLGAGSKMVPCGKFAVASQVISTIN